MYVYYTRKTFTLTYNSNGGSNVPQQSGLYESQQTVNPTAPTKMGYDFAGWYDNPQLSGNPISTTLTLKNNTTLYAKWTPKVVNYKILYYKQQYDNNTNTTKDVYVTSQNANASVGTEVFASNSSLTISSIVDPEIKYQEKDSTKNANSSVVIAPDGSSVLKVYYKLKPYTFVFNLNGPTSSWTGRIRINGTTYAWDTYTIPNVVLGQDISSLWPSSSEEVYDGARRYNFDYWIESLSKTKRFEVTSDLLDLADANNRILQSARWTEVGTKASVEYWLQSADDPKVYVKSDKYSQSFVRTGNLTAKNIFGYVYKKDYTPPNYSASQTSIDPYTYRFYYDRNRYLINYYYNGTLVDTTGPSRTIAFEQNINNSTYNKVPTRPTTVDSDYTWGGWYADATLTVPYQFNKMPSNDLPLYANWIAPKFNVSFDLNGGTSSQPPTQSIEKYKYAKAPSDPSRPYHNFLGWYTQDGKLFSWSDQITKDVKLTARWQLKPLTYRVQYLEEGTNKSLAAEKVIENPSLTYQQSITEYALGITGYRPNSSKQTIKLDYENNLITFYYSPKLKDVTYTVNFVLKDNPSIKVAASKTFNVDGSIVRAKESAVSVDKNYMKTEANVTADMLAVDYYPTTNTQSLILTSDPSKNVITFEYVSYDTKVFTVNYLDMDGRPIPGQEPLQVYQKKPGTFVLDYKAIDGYTFETSKDSENNKNKVFYKVDSGGHITIDLFYKKNLTLTALDKAKVYDSKALISSGISDLNEAYLSNLISGDKLQSISFTGSQTTVGKSATTPQDVVITNALGANRNNYYKISYQAASLEVTPQPVDVYISGETKKKIYDGKSETIGYKVTAIQDPSKLFTESLIQFNGTEADKTITKKDAGEYILNLQSRFTVTNPNFKVTFHVSDGKLTIDKRRLTITSDSATKNYDGTALKAEEYKVSVPKDANYSGFVNGEGVNVSFVEELINPGTMANTFNISPRENTILENYIIEEKYGRLKVSEVINLQKTDLQWKALSGGKFEVTKWDGNNWSQVSGAEGFNITSFDGSNIPVGLEPGRYRLQELAAPDGFIVLDSYIYFKIDENFNEIGTSSYYTVLITDENGNVSQSDRAKLSNSGKVFSHRIQVANEQGKALPHTGGSGQKWFIISGLILMLASYLTQIYVKNRRKGGY